MTYFARYILLSAALLLPTVMLCDEPALKREFRGAWLHTVFQSQYARQTTAQNKAYLTEQLDRLQKAGINVVIFQIRPQADAFYRSNLEPWSRFLSGKAGVAPSPAWDPLAFMIEESHKRGMELHAWLNPYRVTTSAKESLPAGHLYKREPQRFVWYAKKLYFDPGLPENRQFIEDVVRDIVRRYDVDGIHLDDYFYPYPVAGVKFPDNKSYARYGKGMKLADWRRKNVDMLIEGLHKVITQEKPWVRFGVSPFGIWRNKRTDPEGSETSGLQNYDDLYADILLWARNGWIDYQLPQLYWELEHKAASTLTLVNWWNDHAYERHMYIGQDVDRTMKSAAVDGSSDSSQLNHKVRLSRELPNVHGNCWWPGYSVTANVGGVADSLATNLQSTLALVPAYPWISSRIPDAVTGIQTSGVTIAWTAPETESSADDVVKWVIYRFDTPDGIDIEQAASIAAIVSTPEYTPTTSGYYVVTALSRVNNESAPSSPVYIHITNL